MLSTGRSHGPADMTRPADRALAILQALRAARPGARVELDHDSPFRLLIATILSAQCTDARVNLVTPSLFRAWPDAAAFARAPLPDLEKAIRSTGFFRAKARAIKACCQALVDDHGGEVPRTLEEMTRLPGVGRKTANVVLGAGYGIPSGIVVDTHVARVAGRLGLTKQTDPGVCPGVWMTWIANSPNVTTCSSANSSSGTHSAISTSSGCIAHGTESRA